MPERTITIDLPGGGKTTLPLIDETAIDIAIALRVAADERDKNAGHETVSGVDMRAIANEIDPRETTASKK